MRVYSFRGVAIMVFDKVKSKLVLSSSEREVFQKKIIPFTLLGCIVWLIGQIYFWFLFQDPAWLDYIWSYLLVFAFLEFILFIICYTLARYKMNSIGIPLYFLFAFIAGIFTAPIFFITEKFNVYLYCMFSFGLGATIIACYMSILLRDKFFEKEQFWKHVLLFFKSIFLLECFLVLLLKITSAPTIITSLVVLTFTSAMFLLCGALLSKKIKEDYWLVWAFQLLIFLLLTVSFIIVLVVVLIFAMLADGADIDVELPDVGSFASPSTKKFKLHEKMQGYAQRKLKKYTKSKAKQTFKRSKTKFPKQKRKQKEEDSLISFTDEFELDDLIDKYTNLWNQLDLHKETL